MINKKGLSQIIIVLMFILLALVAVGVIWAVVNDLIESGTEKISHTAECLDLDLEVTKSECTESGDCNVTFVRNDGGDAIGGVKLVFTNDLGETNYVHTAAGDVTPLATKTESNITTGIADVTSVEITPYLLDEIGNEVLC